MNIQVEIIYRCDEDYKVVKQPNENITIHLQDYDTKIVCRTYEIKAFAKGDEVYTDWAKEVMLKEFTRAFSTYNDIISIKVQRLVGV